MIPTLDLHKNTVAKYASQIEKECQSGDCNLYYATSYYLNGMLSGVEASGDEELLQQTIGYLDLMIQAATPLDENGITYHVWSLPSLDPNGNPWQLNHFQAMVPFARAAFIISSHPTWKGKYADKARVLTDFARHNGLEYWFDKTHGVYAGGNDWNWVAGKIAWLPPDLGGQPPIPLPPNHQGEWNDKVTLAGTTAAWLAAANPDDLFCVDLTNRIATGFRRRLTLQNGGWVWDVLQVNWDARNTPDHDTSHTNREPHFLIACDRAGIGFAQDDLYKMSVALTDRLWNGDIGDPAFANYLTGRNAPYYQNSSKYEPWQVGNVYAGWAMLGRYNPICCLVMESVLSQVLSGQSSGKKLGGQNFTSHGQVSLSGHCLLNRKVA